jgi:hypothetical protein
LGKVGHYDIEAALSGYLPEISGKKRRVSGIRLSRVAGRVRDPILTDFCGKVKTVDLEPSQSATKDPASEGSATTGHHQYQIATSGNPVELQSILLS